MTEEERKVIDEKNHTLAKKMLPNEVFTYFADLSFVPRGSDDVARFGVFLEDFARKHGLESAKDKTGNVIVRKPAQKSVSETGVILQAHQDMVCVKTEDTEHDFATDPIELVLEGDVLRANGTTLGADDGMGVAIAMAILTDKEIAHPPLEALFTVDEETDMKGAKTVNPAMLEGEILINLDAEDLGIAYISSAAGVGSELELKLETDRNAKHAAWCRVKIEGLAGGHSGIEINKARANAYVLLARFLRAAETLGYSLHALGPGKSDGKDNAIPLYAEAVVGLSAAGAKNLAAMAETWTAAFRNEYRSSDAKCTVTVEAAENPGEEFPAVTAEGRDALLRTLTLLPLGVFRFIQTDDLMSDKLAYSELLVETSCNMGIASLREGTAKLTLLARGSTESVLNDLMERVQGLAAMSAGTLTVTNRTQGWEMPQHLNRVQELFKNQGLHCQGVHAGLECGCLVDLFKKAGRNLDAISIGPDMKEVHTPKERLYHKTVEPLWGQLTAVLSELAQDEGKQ